MADIAAAIASDDAALLPAIEAHGEPEDGVAAALLDALRALALARVQQAEEDPDDPSSYPVLFATIDHAPMVIGAEQATTRGRRVWALSRATAKALLKDLRVLVSGDDEDDFEDEGDED